MKKLKIYNPKSANSSTTNNIKILKPRLIPSTKKSSLLIAQISKQISKIFIKALSYSRAKIREERKVTLKVLILWRVHRREHFSRWFNCQMQNPNHSLTKLEVWWNFQKENNLHPQIILQSQAHNLMIQLHPQKIVIVKAIVKAAVKMIVILKK